MRWLRSVWLGVKWFTSMELIIGECEGAGTDKQGWLQLVDLQSKYFEEILH